MYPSEARTQLLAQHDHVRNLLDGGRVLAARFLAGEEVADLLCDRLTALREAFAAHNELELRVLEPMLRDADVWGPARVARMLEEHRAEHEIFAGFLCGDLGAVARRLAVFAEDIDAHMAAEERTFLSAAVLRDDVVSDGGPTS